MGRRTQGAALALMLALPCGVGADNGPLLDAIRSVGKEGQGNPAATKAWQELVKQGPAALFDVLGAMKGASPVAANYLRSAAESIADRAGKALPADRLEAFVRDTLHDGAARRLAYDYLVRLDPRAPARLLPTLLDDPGAELRRDAVAVAIDGAKSLVDLGKRAEATAAYQKALGHARDRDQVQLIAKHLKGLGVEIDLTKHFGYVTHWLVAGPFDNAGGKGYHTPFPPEKGVDPAAEYQGKDNKPVRWREHVTAKALGDVNFNDILGEQKGVTAYAFTVVESKEARPVEIRATSNNAVRIYLNGREIFGREEYHHGTRMDQHVGRGTLKAGRNEILIKVCQNEQTEDWARLWSFQLRVTDALGGAVPLTVVTGKGAAGAGGR